MDKKKICFIAQFPPPIHGLSKAVDTLYNSSLKEEFEFEKNDITNNKYFLKSILAIMISDADLFYFTISQTIGGNLRDLMILKLLEIRKKKCLVHLHGGYYRKLVDEEMYNWQKKANYKAIKKLSGAIVLGPTLKYIFEGMIPDERIFTVPNCVDDEYLISDKDLKRKKDSSKKNKIKHVLFLSNFIKEKGYQKVLELVKLEKERCDLGGEQKLYFDFAGCFFEKNDKIIFEKFIVENKLENFITYHGVVSGDKKRELLRKGDFFILLTSYKKEGQPISILEAMGNGMFIVATRHAGIPDIVIDGVNGMVVEKEHNILDIYNRIIHNNDLMLVQEKNVCMAKEFYDEKNYIKNMRNVFEKIYNSGSKIIK